MSTTAVSKVQKGASGSVDWRIENWAEDFDLLKNHAKCTLEITEETTGNVITSCPVKIRFSLKENEQMTHILLYGELLTRGQASIAILLDIQTGTTNPASLLEKVCEMNAYGQSFIIQENFILKENTGTYDRQTRIYDTAYPKHTELNFKITATILNFNEDALFTEGEEGAVGGCHSMAEAYLVKDVKLMYNAEENYSDLKIETKDNMTLSGHRFILAARSSGFRKLIDEQLKQEGFSGTLKVPINAKPLIVVLHWMYTGELHENAGRVMEEVMEICVEYEIPVLLKILDKKLITICTVGNMFQLFQAAQQHGLCTAKETISEFIKENIGSI